MTVSVIANYGRSLTLGDPIDDGHREPCDLCHITLAQIRVDSGDTNVGEFCVPCVESAVWDAVARRDQV